MSKQPAQGCYPMEGVGHFPPGRFSSRFCNVRTSPPPFTGGVLVFELCVATTTDTLDLVIILSEVNPATVFDNYKWSYLSNLTTTTPNK